MALAVGRSNGLRTSHRTTTAVVSSRNRSITDMKTIHEKEHVADSVSPMYSIHMAKGAGCSVESIPRLHLWPPSPQQHSRAKVGKREAQDLKRPEAACQKPRDSSDKAIARSKTTSAACSPRSPAFLLERPIRPAKLSLAFSNDSTVLSVTDLRQLICESDTGSTTTTQIPADRRPPVPPTPTTARVMGNNPSSVPNDGAMAGSVQHTEMQRNSKRLPRKSSYNLFKRTDGPSPLPRNATASVMSVIHHGKRKDAKVGASEDDEDDTLDASTTDPFLDQPNQEKSRYPEFGPVHSTSTVTMVAARPDLPGGPCAAAQDMRSTDTSWEDDFSEKGSSASDLAHAVPDREVEPSHLKLPTLPAPSPLPEDSPHKYGLRDEMDTPELVAAPPVELKVAKPRRASTGVELFHVSEQASHPLNVGPLTAEQEVKSLQSAASFLNGLSSSRRRAESAGDHRRSDTSVNAGTSNKASAQQRPSSSRQASDSRTDGAPEHGLRRRGHNFKASGFAYSRALTFVQTSCFRKHARLLASKNKHAPVECGVCHIDDDDDHWSCSWCALRMCKYCRKDFGERGLDALRERIRTAELGGGEQQGSSSESLV